MNITANALLSIGASPVMAHALEEVEDMVRLSSAVVINIGTLSPAWVEAMKKAIRAAALKIYRWFLIRLELAQHPTGQKLPASCSEPVLSPLSGQCFRNKSPGPIE